MLNWFTAQHCKYTTLFHHTNGSKEYIEIIIVTINNYCFLLALRDCILYTSAFGLVPSL